MPSDKDENPCELNSLGINHVLQFEWPFDLAPSGETSGEISPSFAYRTELPQLSDSDFCPNTPYTAAFGSTDDFALSTFPLTNASDHLVTGLSNAVLESVPAFLVDSDPTATTVDVPLLSAPNFLPNKTQENDLPTLRQDYQRVDSKRNTTIQIHTDVQRHRTIGKKTKMRKKGAKKDKRCMRCALNRRKCEGKPICISCSLVRLPRSLCVRVRFSDQPIFQKWTDKKYQSLLQWSTLHWQGHPQRFVVHHYRPGPFLEVIGCAFTPTNNDQTKLWGKSTSGWRMVETSAWGLYSSPPTQDIEKYVSECMQSCVRNIDHNGVLQAIIAQGENQQPGLLKDALRLWTANHILMKGWQAAGVEPITDPADPYYGMSPAPRVMQNGLDSGLESYVSTLERILLAKIDSAMKDRKQPSKWEDIFSAIFVLLAVMEKDIWRLMYWVRHKEEAYEWRHPESARQLINRAVFQANILLAHLRIAGDVPAIFAGIESHFPGGSADLRYHETDDSSINGTLTQLAVIEDDFKQVAETDFS